LALSVSAMGCKGKASADDSDVAPEENPDTAPAVEKPAPTKPERPVSAEHGGQVAGVEHDAYLRVRLRTDTAPIAPPGLRTEVVPVSPGANYLWTPGYWRWGGREYNWVGGRYVARRQGYYWSRPWWGYHGGRYHYYRGYWRRY